MSSNFYASAKNSEEVTIKPMPNTRYWILDKEHRPVEVGFETWAAWKRLFCDDRKIGDDAIGNITVITLFEDITGPCLTIRQLFHFKTWVLNGGSLEMLFEYETWDDAKKGHDALVEKIRKRSQ